VPSKPEWRRWRPQSSRCGRRCPRTRAPRRVPRRAPSGRRPGGQPGHAGHTRGVGPVAAADVVGPVKPERCRRCPPPLVGEEPHPQRHQVTEMPPVQPVVTEDPLHPLVCPLCGEVTPAELPRGVPTGGCGPRGQALTAVCTGAYHVSKRTTPELRQALFGVSIGLGTVASLEPATLHAVADAWRQGGAGTPGGTLLGLVGDGARECLPLVSHLAVAVLWGAPAARDRSDEGA
jgi:transposase